MNMIRYVSHLLNIIKEFLRKDTKTLISFLEFLILEKVMSTGYSKFMDIFLRRTTT